MALNTFFSVRASVTTSYQLLSTVMAAAGYTGQAFLQDPLVISNADAAETLYVAIGYSTIPTGSIGAVVPKGAVTIAAGANTNLIWVKSTSALSADCFVGGLNFTNQINSFSSDASFAGATTFAGLATFNGFYRNAGTKRITANVTNATATMANLTDLTMTLVAGRKYVGRMVVKCADSTAAEGIAFDFDGGTATMTSFAAGAGLLTGGTTVASVTVSSAIATDLVWTTITGETWLTINISFVVNAAGTFIPRVAQGTAHTSGTATVNLGTYLILEDSP